MNAVSHVKTIAKRELAAYFASPVAYVFIVIFLFLMGLFTYMVDGFFERGEASLGQSFFVWIPWFYVILVPAIGMRLWSEERRLGTMELLLTFPISTWQAILGKFIASWVFLGVALFLTFPVWITVNYLGNPDNGVIFAGYIGSFLMAGAYLAVTCMTSAMTRNQVVSFIVSVVICLLLMLAGWPPIKNFLELFTESSNVVDLVAAFSFMTHFEAFHRGVIDSRDLLYFAIVVIFSLFTTGVIIRNHRAG